MKTAMEKSSHRQVASCRQMGRDTIALPDRGGVSLAQSSVDRSPAVAAQRMQIEGAFGKAFQRQPLEEEEEEPLQGNFATLQRQPLEEEEEELLQGKFAALQRQPLEEEEEEPLQGKFAPWAPAALQKETPPNRTGLPDELKAGVESLSGLSLDDVHVHYNSSRPAELQALAYTQGADIHVAPGQERHLPHEAWHVVQQMQGRVKPTMQMKDGIPVNNDRGLEREADIMGARAVDQALLPSGREPDPGDADHSMHHIGGVAQGVVQETRGKKKAPKHYWVVQPGTGVKQYVGSFKSHAAANKWWSANKSSYVGYTFGQGKSKNKYK